MYILYGIEKFLHDDTGEQVLVGTKQKALATFDTEEEGVAYIAESKTPIFHVLAPIATPENQFKETSLLYGFHNGVLEPQNSLPNNPTLDQDEN